MLQGVAGVVLDVVIWAVIATRCMRFVHAAIQRPDAYTAADKLTKPVWLLILGISMCWHFARRVRAADSAPAPPGVYLVGCSAQAS